MRFLPAALLLLASCVAQPTDSASNASTIGRASAPSVSEQAALLKTQAQGQVNSALGTGRLGDASSPPRSSAPAGTAPEVPVDRGAKFETVDVFTDLMDPSSSKNLVAYLMKPDEWMVVRVDMPSPTTRWWRFQRVARTDGKPLPDVDPLRRR